MIASKLHVTAAWATFAMPKVCFPTIRLPFAIAYESTQLAPTKVAHILPFWLGEFPEAGVSTLYLIAHSLNHTDSTN